MTTRGRLFKKDIAVTVTNVYEDPRQTKSACDCPHLYPTSLRTLDALAGYIIDAQIDAQIEVLMGKETYDNGLSLKPVSSPKYASNYPYLVVTTDADVIADHNAIYNENFTLFVHQFFKKHIQDKKTKPLPADSVACWPEEKVPGGLLPTERSCDDGDKPCTWQTLTN